MKKRYIILSIIFMGSALTSCSDYLDMEKDLKDRMTIEEVFSKRDYTESWLAEAYSYITNGNADMGFGGECPFAFSDDLYHPTYKSIREQTYLEGKYQSSWANSYLGIRQASIFIANVDNCLQLSEADRADYKAQARFIRAFYYWKLLQKYGPIPLIPDEGQDYSLDYTELSLPRNTYDECVEYICSEMVLAAKDLPTDRELFTIARPTRGAALSVRAKVLLYAASPLMNGSTSNYAAKLVDDKGNRLLAAENNNEKWAKAAAAALDVIELGKYQLYTASRREADITKKYFAVAYPTTIEPFDDGDFSTKKWPEGYADIDPFESYRSVFNGELMASQNPELIFTRGQNQGSSSLVEMMKEQSPAQTGGGSNKLCMTQKQCDAYYKADGTDVPGKDLELGRGDGSLRPADYVTATDGDKYLPLIAGVSMQYAEREPRFYASVSYNGSQWTFTSATADSDKGPMDVWYYHGLGQDYTGNGGLITGIGVKKFVLPRDAMDVKDAHKIVSKPDVAIRYAEILLIYAEAINELTSSYNIPSWNGEKSYALARTAEELKKGIQPVRIRAGIPDYTQAEYEDVNLFRAKLKRERQIELMGEGHRYFDLRRWEDAGVEESLPIYGCNTNMSDKESHLFHQPVRIDAIRTRFIERSYFWPINIEELYRNRRLTQNPGWQVAN